MKEATMKLFRALIAVAALVLVTSAIACGSAGPAVEIPPTPTAEVADRTAGVAKGPEVTKAATLGGALNIRRQREMVSFDPHYAISTNDNQNNMHFYSMLVKQQDKGAIKPDLAERWELQNNGLKYTFNLRKDVKFHDGTALTAKDVVYSLNRAMGRTEEKKKSDRTGILDSYIKSITATNDATVEMELVRPAVVLLEMLTSGFGAILPAGTVANDLRSAPRGSGPWMMDEWVKGSHLQYKKNTKFYLQGVPYIDSLKHWMINDEAAFEAAFLTKKVDVGACQSLDCHKRTDEMEARGELLKNRTIGYSLTGLGINIRPNAKGPWTDKRVRKAMQLVYDHQAHIAAILDGKGILTSYLSSGTPWGRPEDYWKNKPGYRQPKDQDIAEAKKLMQEAGFPNGFEVEMQVRNDQPDRSKEAELWANQLGLISIKPKIILRDSADIFERGSDGRYEVWQHAWAFFTTDPDELLGIHFLKGATRNYFGYDRADFNALFEQMSRETDPKKRQEMVTKLEDMVSEDLPVIVEPQSLASTMWWPYVENWNPGWNAYVDSRKDEVWINTAKKK